VTFRPSITQREDLWWLKTKDSTRHAVCKKVIPPLLYKKGNLVGYC